MRVMMISQATWIPGFTCDDMITWPRRFRTTRLANANSERLVDRFREENAALITRWDAYREGRMDGPVPASKKSIGGWLSGRSRDA